MFRRAAGACMLLLACALTAWIAYNLFVERLPETANQSPLPALLLCVGLLYVGAHWIRGRGAP